MRISRGCYDKFRRCPGWAGAGFRYPKVSTCDNGMLPYATNETPHWQWRFQRCNVCGILVLPSITRWLDPSWLKFFIAHQYLR